MAREVTVTPSSQISDKLPVVVGSEIEYTISPVRHRTKLTDQVLTRDEFMNLMQVAALKGRAILCLGILGLRATEIGRCDGTWFDWGESIVTIPASVAKKEHSRRVFFGFSPVRDILWSYFSLSGSIGLTRSAVWKAVKKIASKAGHRKPLTVHGLRATGATWAAQRGYSAQAIQELFGWNHLRTAERYIALSGRTGIKESKEKGGLL